MSAAPEFALYGYFRSSAAFRVRLIPQMANARRIQMALSCYPTLLRIEEAAYGLPAFVAARPENQPDAE